MSISARAHHPSDRRTPPTKDMAEDTSKNTTVWGLHEVAGALEAGHLVSRVYLAREASGTLVDRIKELARCCKILFNLSTWASWAASRAPAITRTLPPSSARCTSLSLGLEAWLC